MTGFDAKRHMGWVVWLMAALAVVLFALSYRFVAGTINDFKGALEKPTYHAEVEDSQQLLNACIRDRDFCTGFISGAVKAEEIAAKYTKLCSFDIPDGETEDQLVDIVELYLAAHRENYLANRAVVAALADAFPCEK